MDKKEINKDISVLHLVCYLDNKTNKLLWIEQCQDNSENVQTNTNSYKHDHNDKILKTEELLNQMDADYEYYTQELKTLRSIIKNKEKRNAELFVISNNYLKALEDIEEIVKQTCRKRCTNDCLGARKYCGYGAIFNIINKAKGEKYGGTDEQ